ncbi:hypothetical protein FPY71_09645 [Aureimonas fodinaquatilis]|uniref:DUF4148 domain-containing protein n=1 Tax=Aureimonas fodinaquatilis TaxID=2565783 RepID=A0A5B0DVH0_9HYPH|nr:hypothetical protein [Aureimonas fodinaquatilis]KAA0970734.1 hypothetical protein FPY71_09645 [Aureimonas fodinaquatilis]
MRGLSVMMATGKHRMLVALALCLPLAAGCQSYLPQNDTPVRMSPVADRMERGPSGQRLDDKGYPIIGAYPRAATQQVADEVVAQTQAQYAGAANRANAGSAGDYQRKLAELQATAARQRAANPAITN